MHVGRAIRPAAALALLAAVSCGRNPDPNTVGQRQGDSCSGAWVRLFDDANFSDRRLTISYPTEHRSLEAAGTDSNAGNLNDEVSSARWSIPPRCKFVLYEDEEFRGEPFQLIGSGGTEENSNFGGFSDKASSVRWERR